ncbi:VOC family protein [Rhizobium sp. L1K21]|uniref:VOC family protein n=1 Tax=Rhizobium sp. L1K21 TaxID=2954933 RepID=UPI0020922D7F|nr:VOC family protein [Rhizobium sp. L1K21]MCO6187575.1 VOC family protein [Rhizobium sp. L1K21]
MKIIGPDQVYFGVDDLNACRTFLTDYGLRENAPGYFEALDGTGCQILKRDDPSLPEALPTATLLRKTVYGCVDQNTVEEIAAELEKDREVKRLEDGSIEAKDDAGFVLGFQVTIRRDIKLVAERVNSPGAEPARLENDVAADPNGEALPRTLSHVVYFVPDVEKAEAFYVNRLKFVETDRFIQAGPFLRPGACRDHHTLFLIHTPPHMQGLEHIAFHMQGPTDLMLAGSRMVQKGYESFWGPGRHQLGSNWFWYFNSPLATHFEFDADMDLHDDNWVSRHVDLNAANSQLFLFENREKWSPGPPPEG